MQHHRFLAIIGTLLWTGSLVLFGAWPETEGQTIPSVEEARWLAVVPGAEELWAAWEMDDGSDVDIYFSRRTGKEWTFPQPVHRRPQAWDRTPALAMLPNGELWLAWSSAERETPRQSRIYISRWNGGRWTDPEAVPQGHAIKAKEPVLAAAPDGTVWLAWVGLDGVDDEIFAQYWDGTSWSLPVQVNAPDQDRTLYDRQPRLAVGKDGRPWLVWVGHQAGPDDEIYASRWTGAGWSPEQLVSMDDDLLDVSPSLAFDAEDRPWVAWQGRVTEQGQSHLRILTAHWNPSHAAWTSEGVASSPLTSDLEEGYPVLYRDGGGELHLVWVVSGRIGSALAHASLKDGRWTEPELVHVPAQDDAVVLTSGESGQLLMLQLDQASDAQVPLEGTVLEEGWMPLAQWVQGSASPEQVQAAPILNRYLAFGDSITWGQYGGFYPYPAHLEDKLDARVIPSEVINSGVPGETTNRGRDRIEEEVSSYQPQFVLYMEGTNDVSHLRPPANVYDNIQATIYIARHAGVDNVKVMVATIVPRLDNLNDETEEMNELAIKPAAQYRNAPICDQWQAFYNYGPWKEIYWDEKHPDGTGLQLIADTFYQCILSNYTWLHEDTNPPTTWIEPLPAQTECGEFRVQWNGTDNLSYVVSYDVQKQVNYGAWADWIIATPMTSALYTSHNYGEVIGFRVRGRDLLGNQSEYSAPIYTQISDSGPPEAHMNALPPAQTAPFPVSWWGADACSNIVAYNVQYRVGAGGVWQNWKVATTSTGDSFSPAASQYYGETYYFRAQARDAAGNWGFWSDPSEAYTRLAQFSVAGHIYNGRHQPVAAATVSLAPPSLWTKPQPLGRFVAYIANSGTYSLAVSRPDRFGPLPPMVGLAVSDNVTGLEFILPPQDGVITDGQFEAGNLDAWQLGGTLLPTLTSTAHTGQWAVRLGGPGHDSSLSQAVALGTALTDPTLSFLARLETAGQAGAVQVTLAGPTGSPSFTLPVESDQWTHTWFDLTGWGSGPFTLTLSVSDDPPVLVDEISLGSALPGSWPIYLPAVYRAW